MKLRSCCRERKMQFSGPTLRSLANSYTELERLCRSISAEKAFIWNNRPANTLHVAGTFVFSHQKCHIPQTFYRLENSMSFNFCGSMSIFGEACAEIRSLQYRVVGQKKSIFMKYLKLNIKLELLSMFPEGS